MGRAGGRAHSRRRPERSAAARSAKVEGPTGGRGGEGGCTKKWDTNFGGRRRRATKTGWQRWHGAPRAHGAGRRVHRELFNFELGRGEAQGSDSPHRWLDYARSSGSTQLRPDWLDYEVTLAPGLRPKRARWYLGGTVCPRRTNLHNARYSGALSATNVLAEISLKLTKLSYVLQKDVCTKTMPPNRLELFILRFFVSFLECILATIGRAQVASRVPWLAHSPLVFHLLSLCDARFRRI